MLCSQTRRLCLSHIVPKFFVRELRFGGPSWFEHDLRAHRRPAVKQDGWKEHLLCNQCEGRIGRWEKVVAEEMQGRRGATITGEVARYHGPIRLAPTKRPEYSYLDMQNCDYAAWRLFTLSLLWRMDTSTLPELEQVELGEHASSIKEMILEGDPGEPLDYPCFVYTLWLDGKRLKGFMSSPHETEYKGYPAFEMAFGGMGWLFIIGRDVRCTSLPAFAMSRTGQMRMMVRDGRHVNWLWEGVRRIEALGNWSDR